jgi:hypothetical protein
MATIIPTLISAAQSLRIQQSMEQTLASVETSMRLLRAALERYDTKLLGLVDEAQDLGRRGWTFPMLMAVTDTPTFLARVREIDDLDSLFEDFYGKDSKTSRLFDDLLEADALLRWRPLLRECIESFNDNRFLIVVPSLLLIFEGVLALAAKSFNRKVKIDKLSSDRLKGAEDGHESVSWGSIRGFGSELFRPHDFAKEAPGRLNRNWVLHGRSPANWTRPDCLRLFQAIHTVLLQVKTSNDEMSPDA